MKDNSSHFGAIAALVSLCWIVGGGDQVFVKKAAGTLVAEARELGNEIVIANQLSAAGFTKRLSKNYSAMQLFAQEDKVGMCVMGWQDTKM